MRITTDYINFGNILKHHLLNKYPSHKGEFSKTRCCNMGIRFRKEENRFGIYRFDYFAICSLSKCLMQRRNTMNIALLIKSCRNSLKEKELLLTFLKLFEIP